MLKLDKLEILNLYFLLSESNNISLRINNVLLKLEKEIFENYTVMEIESYKSIYDDKGRI